MPPGVRARMVSTTTRSGKTLDEQLAVLRSRFRTHVGSALGRLRLKQRPEVTETALRNRNTDAAT